MSEKFDPYYTWLAIPPEEQPPHHYRLLGVKPLEENFDVIENAADQRMLHLRTYQSGKQAELSQKLLNEVSTAKVVLLDPAKKSPYDAELRTKLNAAKQAELKKAREERPLATAKPLPTAAPLDAKPALAAERDMASGERRKSDAPQFSTPTPAVKPRGSNNLVLLIAAGVVALVLLAGGGIAAMMLLPGRDDVVAGDPSQANPILNRRTTDDPASIDDAKPVVPPVIPPQDNGEKPPVDPPSIVEVAPSAEAPAAEEPPADDPIEPNDEDPSDEPSGEEVAVTEESAAPEKLAVPDKTVRETKRKEILAIFPVAQARSFEERGEIAAQLIRTAQETVDDPAAVFALLNLAREQAAEAGQIKLAFEATDLLAETFDFDGDAVRLASVQQASRANLPPAAKRDIVIAGMDMIDELSSADKFDDADTLSDRMLALARPLRDAELSKNLADQRRTLQELAASFKKAQSAFETLKQSPDDTEANLAAGRYLAFVKQDWEAGLAHLAKGSDATLVAAAKAELAAPDSPADQEKIADAWWAAAEAQRDAAVKDACREQAVYWYREIVGALTGLAKVKIEKRIDEARDAAGSVAAVERAPRRKPKGPLPAEIVVTGRKPAAVTMVQGMPKEFAGFKAFEWEPSAQRSGALEFTVERPGMVYLSASFPETKYEGNNSGGWYEGRATREKLVQAGWRELGKCPWDDTRYLYVRMAEKGGPYRIQTNKYGAPDVYLPPDPLATAVAARTEPEPDLGIFSRDPAELDAPPKGDTVYLDDLEESSAKVEQGGLGKHGSTGSWNAKWTFGGKVPEHALSTHCGGEVFVEYKLDRRYANFATKAAIWEDPEFPRSRAASAVTFRVLGDGKKLWESKPVQDGGASEDCNIDVRQVTALRLEVQDAGNYAGARAVWIEPRLTSSASKPTKKPIRRTDLQPQQALAVAAGSNHHTVFVNGQKLLDCGRDKATSAPCVLKPGDVITVRMGDRFDIKSFWMMVLSEKGEYLFETSENWLGYMPVDDARWWDVSTKDLRQEPAQFTGDGREYVNLVQAAAAAISPKFKKTDKAKPIFSPIMGKDNYAATFLAYVVTVDDMKPKKASADDDAASADAPRLPKRKKPNPKAFYNCVIGGYMNYHESKPVYPLLNLQVPRNNLWNDEYAAQLQNMVRDSLAYRGQARFFAPQDGDYDVQGVNMGVAIDGVKLAGWRDPYTERVTLRKGLHTIVLDSHTHGQPFLQNASAKIIDPATGEALPFVNLWADVQAALATPVGGQRVVEISGWQPDEDKIVPLKLN